MTTPRVKPARAAWGHAGVGTLPGVGPKRAEALANLGIHTVGDLLRHFPRDYDDRRVITAIGDAVVGSRVTIRGEVKQIRSVRVRRRRGLAEGVVADETGEMRVVWFGMGYLAESLATGATLLLTGVVSDRDGPLLQNPSYEIAGDDDGDEAPARLTPVYPLTEGLTPKQLRQWIAAALVRLPDALPDSLPENVRARYGYPALREALEAIHFPCAPEDAKRARERFVYEELLSLQLALGRERRRRKADARGVAHVVDGPLLAALRETLPFALTAGQENAAARILADMALATPMRRLVQGDVGCGKTAVALHAVAAAADGGFQTAVMAPTEVLAEQHGRTFRRWLESLGLTVAVLTGSAADARAIRVGAASGAINVVVGTQALIQKSTAFANLGLVIVDEQHRFGVRQRVTLANKGRFPDLLHLTATPIPRSLALALEGAVDLTIIDELPPGRQPVKTSYVPEEKVGELYGFIETEAHAGRQTYYVCPLIEESEELSARAVMERYESLSSGPLAQLRTGLLHGRLDSAEKESVLRAFERAELDVLFTTTVIEVGVDVPQATVMIIEDAARFGLAQLHQLRGRVGRGQDAAWCFLLGRPTTESGRRRIETLCATNSGFDIAEADLELRGPGELLGLRQAGIGELRVADLRRDAGLLLRARQDADALLDAE